jgi:hypothetical protein
LCHTNRELTRRNSDVDRQKKKERKWNLKRSYNITLEDYDELLLKQKNCCAICGKHQSNLTRTLFVDHCHTTGKVRGLLCHHCNILLGNAEDNITVLESAISYLTTSIKGV